MTENERRQALWLSNRIDQLLSASTALGQVGGLALAEDEQPGAVPVDAGLLSAAARLAALPDLLPQPDAAFERRVWARLQAVEGARGHLGRWRLRLPALAPMGLRLLAPLVALVLLVTLALPGPRQALATWVAHFQVGGVQVAVVPEETVRPPLAAQQQRYSSVAEAQRATGFALLQPTYLPQGYALTTIEAVTYPQLPPWLQPLYVEINYAPADASPQISYYVVLREFNAAKSGGVQVSEIEFSTESVRTARDVTLPNGLSAVLIELEEATEGEHLLLRQLIWEQAGLTLELWSQVLSVEEMLHIAGSLQ